jgi:hypothetical protein
MAKIKFIQSRGGPTTAEEILQLIQENPQGLTIKSISKEMNRPVSMLNICLRNLIKDKQVKVKLSDNKMQQIYQKC